MTETMKDIHINDLVSEIEAHRVTFIPDRNKYIGYIFELSCREMERHGFNPVDDTQTLGMYMRSNLWRDLQYAKVCYSDDRIHKWVTPDSKEINKYLDIKFQVNKGLY
jgi:hypothetical protein